MQTIRGQLRLRMPGLTACLRTHWLFPIVSPVPLSFLHKRPELGWLKPQLHKAIQSFVHNNNNNNITTPTETGKQTRPRPNDLAPSQRFLGRRAASAATSEPKNCKSSASSLNSPTVERGRWLFRPHPPRQESDRPPTVTGPRSPPSSPPEAPRFRGAAPPG